MFHVKLGHPISQTSGKGGTATSRASRRCSSCASESCRSEFLESVAPARNSEGPAFAEPPISEGSFRILASRKGAQSRCAGSRPRDARCQLRPSRIHRAPCRLARVFPPPFDAPPTSLKSIELLRATGISVATGFSRDRLLHLNGKNRTSGTGRNGRRETQLATLPGRRSREGWAERNGGGHGKGKRNCFKEASPLPALSLDARSNLLRHAEALEGLKQRQPQHVHDKRLAHAGGHDAEQVHGQVQPIKRDRGERNGVVAQTLQ